MNEETIRRTVISKSGPDCSDYRAAISFLYGRINFERMPIMPYRTADLKLQRMRKLLQLLGDPHRNLKIIHVAGTKGKGSTCAMISSVLRESGYKTGVYSSPHLHDLEERFVVSDQQCTPSQLTDLIQTIRPVVDTMDTDSTEFDGPTFFEITTAIALLHFANESVDFAVLEVGLGGRLDSTNVCQPVVSVITSISYDHTKQLGDTLAKIAFEKAGIIKPKIPVVSGVRRPEARDVIRSIAQERQCPFWELDSDFHVTSDDQSRSLVRVRGTYESSIGQLDRLRLADLEVGLPGEHQLRNAAVAVAACETLQRSGVQISEEHIRAGLLKVRCPARIELACESPLLVIDAAHNGASVQALINSIEPFLSRKPNVMIMATTQGKDYESMLKNIGNRFDVVIFTKYLNNPRAVSPAVLADTARQIEMDSVIEIRATPQTALAQAEQLSGQSGFICVTGSFFIAAEIRELLGPIRNGENVAD